MSDLVITVAITGAVPCKADSPPCRAILGLLGA